MARGEKAKFKNLYRGSFVITRFISDKSCYLIRIADVRCLPHAIGVARLKHGLLLEKLDFWQAPEINTSLETQPVHRHNIDILESKMPFQRGHEAEEVCTGMQCYQY